jgi:sigma-E factor negative regulatory protein RseC
MAEIGIVTQVIEDEVVVKLKRSEACASCGACSNGLESKDMFIHAKNYCLAEKDQWVEITLNESNFIQAVAIMYGIPLIGLMVGIFIGFGIGVLFFETMIDLLSIGFGLLSAGLCFFIINRNEQKFRSNKYKARAIRIVEGME